MTKKTVTLQPGESKVVVFTYTPTEPGVHQVSVDGLSGSFMAIEPPVPVGGWVSPTSHSDPGAAWTNPEKAYDENVFTSALTVAPAGSWSSYLILQLNEVFIDKIRFNAFNYYPTIVIQVDIDVYYGGAWVDVYEGLFTSRVWLEKDVIAGAQLISKARFRFYNPFDDPVTNYLHEFQFNT